MGGMEEDMAPKALAQPRIAVWPALFTTAALSMLPVPVAHADVTDLFANLSGANEVPPNASPGTGSVEVVLNTTAQTIEINVTFSGLTSNDVAAHIHCCAPLGTNAIVATTMPTFGALGPQPEFPLGVTFGTYDQTFGLLDANFYNPAFVTAHGGTIAGAETALIAGLESQLTYFN